MTQQEREKWEKQGFSQDQICEIEEGQASGLDTDIYARKDYFAIQMRQIRFGLLDGLPVELYARPEYDWFQMEEIRLGLENGIDTTKYAAPGIPYDKMRQVRKGLLAGIDLSPYLRLDAGILRELRKAMLARVNIIKYIKEGYGTEQLRQIRKALKKKLNIDPYLKTEFVGASIAQISEGLWHGVDVSIYAKLEYSWQQMREIRLGLEKRSDVSLYANPFYDWKQMKEIRRGLENGIDVGSYCSLMYTALEMKRKRHELEDGDGGYLVSKKSGFHEADSFKRKDAEYKVEEFSDFVITLSSDEMEAYFLLNDNKKVSHAGIMNALQQRGICQGVIEEAVSQLLEGCDKPLLIAKGTEPTAGEDGWYEYFFRTEEEWVPAMLPDGSVDYQNSQWFEVVSQGQKIAYYHEAGLGSPGTTVTGKLIPPRKGKEQSVLYGKGFLILPDQKTYLAAMDGRIEMKRGKIEISQMLILDDMTIATGKVDFDGAVYIKGNVGSGTYIKATEDIVIDGFIEAANIECGGSVVLRQGVNGAGSGIIRAKKDVKGGFFEAVTIYAAGNIQGNYCMSSNLYAEGRVDINGANGALVGGLICAVEGLSAYHIGNRAGLSTSLKIGFNELMRRRQRELEEKIQEVEKELSIFNNAYMDFKKKYPPEVRNTMSMFLKIEDAIFTKEKEMESLSGKQRELEDMLQRTAEVKISVRGSLFEGVAVEINGAKWNSKEIRNVTLKKVQGRVVLYAN
ncbi:MAG: FapA family protein [Bacillota bacterium]|nr:FapA family protein [Bacillota bacterium]